MHKKNGGIRHLQTAGAMPGLSWRYKLMDRDLARAMVLERCACYDRALDSATKVLEKYDVNSDESFWARKIIKSLGEEFLKQRFADRAMECYRLILRYAPDEDICREETNDDLFDQLGPFSVSVSSKISSGVYEILKKIASLEVNRKKDESELIREGVYLLLLKYAEDKTIRELIFEKMQAVIKDQ